MALLFLPHTLDASVAKLPEVGAAFEKRLGKLGITTIRDLLLTLTFGWETYGGPSEIASLTPGVQATVVGRVAKIFLKTTSRKKMRLTEAMIEDDGGERLRVAWFNNPYVVKNLKQGDRVAVAGMVKAGYGGVPEMQSPHYERLDGSPDAQPSRVGGLMPKYHLVNGLTNRKVAQWVESALPLAGQVEDVLPEEVRARHNLMDVGDAIRLLNGDVGSGKTAVAAACVAMAHASGLQSVVMAPTEILARQHLRKFRAYLEESFPGLTVELLVSSQSAAERRRVRTAAASGHCALVVGTHALIEDDVELANLGLAVVDEQHRFGTRQRELLRGKGRGRPHFLAMTATPIPRTLALASYGEMTLSVIDEMPPGRTPVETEVIEPDERDRAYDLVRAEIRAGHQAFVICPLIEESEVLAAKSATAEYERLKKEVFTDLELGLIHGRLKAKDDVMQRFVAGEIQGLGATAGVEVGVDVPNATVMMIEGAERFGLAQLHQFRGRVGRGSAASRCLLLSSDTTESSLERLTLLTKIADGFTLAEEDMRIRGMGELMGARQHGMSDAAMESLRTPELLSEVRQEAERVLASDSGFEHHPLLKAVVPRRLELAYTSYDDTHHDTEQLSEMRLNEYSHGDGCACTLSPAQLGQIHVTRHP